MMSVFVFILGSVIGSFLNVVILRYNTGESIVKTGSKCFSCGKRLKWHELIPVFSFIIQRGKCRNCRSKISIQYPIVEFLTGLIFLLTFHITHYSLLITGYYFIIFSLLIIITVYDLRHQIIPNLFIYLFDILAFLSLPADWDYFWAGLILFSFFGLLWLLSKGAWMGFGDAKLALGIGWLLGLEKGVTAVLLSFWLGAIAGIFLLIFLKNRYNIKSRIAFGPFLVLGTLVSFFWGEILIKLFLAI